MSHNKLVINKGNILVGILGRAALALFALLILGFVSAVGAAAPQSASQTPWLILVFVVLVLVFEAYSMLRNRLHAKTPWVGVAQEMAAEHPEQA